MAVLRRAHILIESVDLLDTGGLGGPIDWLERVTETAETDVVELSHIPTLIESIDFLDSFELV